MRYCTVMLDQAALSQLLGLPEGAVIEAVHADHTVLGRVHVKVRGAGWDTMPGHAIRPAQVICKNIHDGENRFFSPKLDVPQET